MGYIIKKRVIEGVYWIEIPEIDMRILCGCPADVVKHLSRKGMIVSVEQGGICFETGPNAILLSDLAIQNGDISNMSEFPVLQMLYKQGMIIPNHPNNKGEKPLLIGAKKQVQSQLEYIYIGNYGIVDEGELKKCKLSSSQIKTIMSMKRWFAFGNIKKSEDLIDTVVVEDERVEIRNGLEIERIGSNRFIFSYKGENCSVDLNLKDNSQYESPYPLGYYHHNREYFAIIHSGQGDGWDINRTSMSSVIFFQGKIYLVDCGPNVSYALTALGIGINEIEGIFHTHAHDDHFAGITALMRADHRIKYYSTKLVRSCVTKKLCALLGMSEGDFSVYFDIHDLEFDEWNNIEGLEAMPILSPHPIETNIFYFRTMWEGGYRSYAHLADLTSFNVLDKMVKKESSSNGISKAMLKKVKKEYLTQANIKKVDAGGGMIHGEAGDFRDDQSGKIILAHTSNDLDERQKEIGSSALFGSLDILIPDYQDFLMRSAFHFLRSYFPIVPVYQLRILMNNKIDLVNPGTIILKEGERCEFVYLVLTGSVEMLQTKQNIRGELSAGTLIAEISGLNNLESSETYRSLNYVRLLKIHSSLYREFVVRNNLYASIEKSQDSRDFLRKTKLFGHDISHPIKNKVLQNMEKITLKPGEKLNLQKSEFVYLLRVGELELYRNDKVCAILKSDDFFGVDGEDKLASDDYYFVALAKCEVYTIPYFIISNIPIVNWKMFESYQKMELF